MPKAGQNCGTTLLSLNNEIIITLNGSCTEFIFDLFVDCSINEIPPIQIQSKDIKITITDNANNSYNITKLNGTFLLPPYQNFYTDAIDENIVIDKVPNSFTDPVVIHYAPTNNFNQAQFIEFEYQNITQSQADLNFQLEVVGDYCNQVDITKLEYYDFGTSAYIAFNSNAIIFKHFSANEILKFKMTYSLKPGTTCLTSCSTKQKINFSWWCGSYQTSNDFCTSCLKVIETEYDFVQDDKANIKITRISPNMSTTLAYEDDFSCFNNLTNALEYEYEFENNGNCELQSFENTLYSNTPLNANVLSLIDPLSCNITYTHDGTNWSILPLIPETTTVQLCKSIITNTLLSLNTAVPNFNIGAKLKFKFKTMRCSEENDPQLLDVPKFFNHWQINTKTQTGCESSSSYYPDDFPINYEQNNNASNLHQVLKHYPTKSDLAIPPVNAPVPQIGEWDLVSIECDGIETVQSNYNYQIFGCNSTSVAGNTCAPNGIIRATIDLDIGLFLNVNNWNTDIF
nr:hypothetical protein [Bacteroidota bacterium]